MANASNETINIVRQDGQITVLEMVTDDKGINTLDSIKRAMKASKQVAFYEKNGRRIRITFMPLDHGKISIHIVYAYRYSNKQRRRG